VTPNPRRSTGPSEASARVLSAAGLDPLEVFALVERALSEDLGGDPGRDVTSEATVPAEQVRTGAVVARAAGVVCGLVLWPVVTDAVARRLGMPAPVVEVLAREGQHAAAGDVLVEVTGRTRVLLAAERTALNLTSHLSGVATATRAWVDAVAGTGAQVLDTRKTIPGLRSLEKHAVRCGGGANKRMGLYDVAMVKDNHVVSAGSVAAAHAAVRQAFPDVVVQVEVDTVAQAREAVRGGARFLLCDNMGPQVLREVVAAVREAVAETAPGERVELEATGGLTLGQAPAVAATGVDFLSVGALTHSSPALDVALDLDPDD
jgi:nicotinate-nucleotide pyrophosphorylase (carboxylating)